jgi:uncharacterized protein (DUF302 family)
MKNLLIAIVMLAVMGGGTSKKLKPYILGAEATGSVTTVKTKVIANLKAQGFTVAGTYAPAWDANRYVICVTSPQLINAAKKIGGLTGFAAALRVGLTKEDGVVKISYTNPFYWGNAYYRDDYPKVENYYKSVYNMFIRAMKASGTYKGRFFGSEEGIEIDDLREYQYMMGMPEFDDEVELKEFDSYEKAVAKIDANLKKGGKNFKKVYSVTIPGKKLKLYGIALTGTDGEKLFMPKIDISKPKHTAFLPYEILVNDDEVVMLHGRFRIALGFLDLTMGTFTKIMSAPGDIEDAMEEICE